MRNYISELKKALIELLCIALILPCLCPNIIFAEDIEIVESVENIDDSNVEIIENIDNFDYETNTGYEDNNDEISNVEGNEIIVITELEPIEAVAAAPIADNAAESIDAGGACEEVASEYVNADDAGAPLDENSGLLWEYDETNKKLTISYNGTGTGIMPTIGFRSIVVSENDVILKYENQAPWGKYCQSPDGIAEHTDNGINIIEIGEGIKEIGDNAFYGCKYLTSVTLPNTLKRIGKNAFRDCAKLPNITLPDSLTTIDDYAFCGCTDNHANSPAGTGYGLSEIIIPANVESIGKGAFKDCRNLSTVTGTGLKSISEEAFEGCSALSTVTLSFDNLTSIGNKAFKDCTTLSGNTVQNLIRSTGIHSINEAVFSGCKGISGRFEIPSNITVIGDSAFANCIGITYLALPSTLTNIGKSAFSDCQFITQINYEVSDSHNHIPNNVTNIGETSFKNCKRLSDITLPANNTSIGKQAFVGCTGLTEIVIPTSEQLSSIGDEAFMLCTGLPNLTIPGNIKKIGADSFKWCFGSLTEVTINEGVEEIGARAFSGCKKLKEINLPASLTKIEANAFGACSSNAIIKYSGSKSKLLALIGSESVFPDGATYEYGKLDPPNVSPGDGANREISFCQEVTLSCDDVPEAQIYYTLNGADPTTSSSPYNTSDKISFSNSNIGKTINIKAIAVNSGSGMDNSEIASVNYIIKDHAWGEYTQSDDNTQHKRTCKHCSVEDSSAHTMTNASYNEVAEDSSEHAYKCDVCHLYYAIDVHHYPETWSKETENYAQHFRKCTSCNHIMWENHSYNDFTTDDSIYHKHSCTSCGIEEKKPHDKYISTYSSTQHHMECSECTWSDDEDHDKHEISNDDGTHRVVCNTDGCNFRQNSVPCTYGSDGKCTECNGPKPDNGTVRLDTPVVTLSTSGKVTWKAVEHSELANNYVVSFEISDGPRTYTNPNWKTTVPTKAYNSNMEADIYNMIASAYYETGLTDSVTVKAYVYANLGSGKEVNHILYTSSLKGSDSKSFNFSSVTAVKLDKPTDIMLLRSGTVQFKSVEHSQYATYEVGFAFTGDATDSTINWVGEVKTASSSTAGTTLTCDINKYIAQEYYKHFGNTTPDNLDVWAYVIARVAPGTMHDGKLYISSDIGKSEKEVFKYNLEPIKLNKPKYVYLSDDGVLSWRAVEFSEYAYYLIKYYIEKPSGGYQEWELPVKPSGSVIDGDMMSEDLLTHIQAGYTELGYVNQTVSVYASVQAVVPAENAIHTPVIYLSSDVAYSYDIDFSGRRVATGIELSPRQIFISQGNKCDVKANIIPAGAYYKSFAWSSVSSNIASVSANSANEKIGEVYGKAVGNTVITAKLTKPDDTVITERALVYVYTTTTNETDAAKRTELQETAEELIDNLLNGDGKLFLERTNVKAEDLAEVKNKIRTAIMSGEKIYTDIVSTQTKQADYQADWGTIQSLAGSTSIKYAVSHDVNVEMYYKSGSTKVDICHVTKLNKSVTFRLSVPTLSKINSGYKRSYQLTRKHNGAYNAMPTPVVSGGFFSVTTSEFSDYILTYLDKKSSSTTKKKTSSGSGSGGGDNGGDGGSSDGGSGGGGGSGSGGGGVIDWSYYYNYYRNANGQNNPNVAAFGTITAVQNMLPGDYSSNLLAITPPATDIMNHQMFANFWSSALGGYIPTLIDIKEIYAPPGSSITWRNSSRAILWQNINIKKGDAIFATWYNGEVKDMKFIPTLAVIDGATSFIIPRVGNKSIIAIYKLTKAPTAKKKK